MNNELTNKLEIAVAEKYAKLIPQNIKKRGKNFWSNRNIRSWRS